MISEVDEDGQLQESADAAAQKWHENQSIQNNNWTK